MLDPLQERIARIALAMPGAESLALAGGGAMLAHRLVDRQTQDVDMFTPDDDVVALAEPSVRRWATRDFTSPSKRAGRRSSG